VQELEKIQEFLKSSGLEDAAIQKIEAALGLGGAADNSTAPATDDDAPERYVSFLRASSLCAKLASAVTSR
jgi:hypothetical protein